MSRLIRASPPITPPTWSTQPNGLYQEAATPRPISPPTYWPSAARYFISKAGLTLTYDTRNNFPHAQMPGQVTEILPAKWPRRPGDTDFYKLEVAQQLVFQGLSEGHILELDAPHRRGLFLGRDASVCRFSSGGFWADFIRCAVTDIRPSARRTNIGEPLGGDTYYFGSGEYSIPIIKMLRIRRRFMISAMFIPTRSASIRDPIADFTATTPDWGCASCCPLAGARHFGWTTASRSRMIPLRATQENSSLDSVSRIQF